MTPSVRGAGNGDSVGIQVEIGLVDNLRDHTLQVANLRVQVSEIHLPPRLAKAASRVPQNRVTVSKESCRNVAGARFATAVTVDEGNEWERTGAGWNLESGVEKGLVDIAAEKAIALAAAVARRYTIQLVTTGAGED